MNHKVFFAEDTRNVDETRKPSRNVTPYRPCNVRVRVPQVLQVGQHFLGEIPRGVSLRCFTDCVLLFCFFALLGSVVFSRGSKKVLFWRTVQEQ